MSDLVDRLERINKRHIVRSMPQEAEPLLRGTSVHHHLVEYQTWRGRFIPPQPRRVHASKELQGKAINLASLRSKIEAGDDLARHLSARVHNPFKNTAPPALEHRTDRDSLLADWGVHHLHVSARMRKGGAARGDGVLLGVFKEDDAYLIDVIGHRDNWAARQILSIVVHNWPSAGLMHESRWATAVSPDWSDEDRRDLRNAGVASGLIQIDGKVYASAEIGQTTAGTPMPASRRANALLWGMRPWREDFANASAHPGVPPGSYWTPAVDVSRPGFEEYAGFAAARTFVGVGRIC